MRERVRGVVVMTAITLAILLMLLALFVVAMLAQMQLETHP